MALNVLQQHAKVFLDLLDADNAAPALVVLNGEVPDGTVAPYVLVYFTFRTASGTDEPDKVSLEATSDALYVSAYCHSVGGNQHAALAVAGRVRTSLRGVTPSIASRECGPITHEDSTPVQRDETTGIGVYDLVDVWQFLSLPA